MKNNTLLYNYYRAGITEAGCDEAGRGCLAGPVFAAAVILPAGFEAKGLNDSKKLNAAQRLHLRDIIIKDCVTWGIGILNNKEIDTLNILWASVKAMHQALAKLTTTPGHIIVDGNRFKPYKSVQHTCVVGGDGLYASIAAASVLAKTYRDEYMEELHNKYPVYGWKTNKGYPTASHIEAIKKYGFSEYHRKTFHPKNLMQLRLEF